MNRGWNGGRSLLEDSNGRTAHRRAKSKAENPNSNKKVLNGIVSDNLVRFRFLNSRSLIHATSLDALVLMAAQTAPVAPAH
jgi:hypothetical protein